jgi:hypothetical protein
VGQVNRNPDVLARKSEESTADFARRIIDAAKQRGVSAQAVVSKANAYPGTLTPAEHQLLVAHHAATKGLPA